MLKKLIIKDYALIDQLCIEFGPGLNILTGETGTGKSIIIGALSLLLGERTGSDIIRQRADVAVVEGWFDIPASFRWELIDAKLDKNQDELLLRREVHRSGRSRAFANDSPIPNTVLAAIGDLLIDLHGQHAHQTLLHERYHLDYLDNFGIEKGLLQQLKESYARFKSLTTELKALQGKETILQEKLELLEFQVQEIDKAAPQEGEEEALELEDRKLRNSEKLFQAAKMLNELLYDGEGSVSERLSTAETSLAGLTDVDPVFEKWIKEAESARIVAEEIAKGFQSYISKIEFDPQRLEEIRERLGLFSRLKKKYGGSIQQVLEFRSNAKKELDQIETLEKDIGRITEELSDERDRLALTCQKVSQLRVDLSSELAEKTLEALSELGLKNGIFRVRILQNEHDDGPIPIESKRYTVSSRGIDTAEFLISLNPGEEPKPLSKIASGGEISRIMLALKTVLAEADEIPVLVFDEIDTGISGRIARVVGKNLRDVSIKHQVICITHLPQIASMGDVHFRVDKEVVDKRSRTTIRRLQQDEQVVEIAKLIGGEKITESALQSARELLNS